MEITNEIKAKVFAQYLGVSWITGNSEGQLNYYTLQYFKDCHRKLILKSLSEITDEDVIESARLCGVDAEIVGLALIRGLIQSCSKSIGYMAYQFLQSKGYDLPQYLLSGKTLKEAGLAIYESDLTPKEQ